MANGFMPDTTPPGAAPMSPGMPLPATPKAPTAPGITRPRSPSVGAKKALNPKQRRMLGARRRGR